MHRILRPDHTATCLDCPVCNHLVDVHVGLGARAGHPDVQGKFVIQSSVDDLPGRRLDKCRTRLVQHAQFRIDPRRRRLDPCQGMNDLDREQIASDGKVVPGPLGLRAPITVRGHVDRAHGVGFPACFLRTHRMSSLFNMPQRH